MRERSENQSVLKLVSGKDGLLRNLRVPIILRLKVKESHCAFPAKRVKPLRLTKGKWGDGKNLHYKFYLSRISDNDVVATGIHENVVRRSSSERHFDTTQQC